METVGKWKTITSYAYDDENRLTLVTIQKRDKIREISFAYDPFGRRISQTVEKEEFTDLDNDKDNGKEGKEDKDNHHGHDKDGHHDEGVHPDKHGHDDYPKQLSISTIIRTSLPSTMETANRPPSTSTVRT